MLGVCQFGCGGLLKELTGRRREDNDRLALSIQDVIKSLTPRLWLHEHAGTATVRTIVYRFVLVVGVVAKVVDAHLEQLFFTGLTEQREL